MKELFAAIYTQFNATNDLKTALGGRMYPYEAPQNVTFPYCVYSMVSDMHEQDFSDDHEYIDVQFSLFSEENSLEQVGTLYGYLKELFDNQTLTVSGYDHLTFTRGLSQLIKDVEMGTWHYVVEYEVLLERGRT